MKSNDLYYQESGNFSTLGIVISFVAILGAAVGLAYIYTLLIYYIPIIYFNVIITFGFGLSIGLIGKVLFRLTHNRSRMSQYVLVIIFGLFAYYFHWVAYLLFAYQDSYISFGEYFSQLNMIFSPTPFFSFIGDINTYGLWSLFGGIAVNGIVLTIVWIIEAAMIIVPSIILVHKRNIYPYSELSKKWYPKFTLDRDFEMTPGLSSFLPKLEKDPKVAIADLGKSEIISYSKIHIYFLPEEMTQYLSFENNYVDDKGKKDQEVIIENFKISQDAARQILDEFKHKRDRFVI